MSDEVKRSTGKESTCEGKCKEALQATFTGCELHSLLWGATRAIGPNPRRLAVIFVHRWPLSAQVTR